MGWTASGRPWIEHGIRVRKNEVFLSCVQGAALDKLVGRPGHFLLGQVPLPR